MAISNNKVRGEFTINLHDFIQTKRDALVVKSFLLNKKQYEMAEKVRDIERLMFPESEEDKAKRKRAEQFSVALRLLNMKLNPKWAFMILLAARKFGRRGGNMSLTDTVEIKAEAERVFGE